MDAKIVFTIDWEAWYHSLVPYNEWPYFNRRCGDRLAEPTLWLLEILDRFNIRAVWYLLGGAVCLNPDVARAIVEAGHEVGSHGYYHERHEVEGDTSDQHARQAIQHVAGAVPTLYRSPYWDSTPRPGWSGGFFFRNLPYPLFLHNLKQSGVFYLHPWELDPTHPNIHTRLAYRRHYMGLNGVRQRLLRLFEDVQFADPAEVMVCP